MVNDDTVNMAASLSLRNALVARSTSISTGAIVGATIGSVIGAALILLCILPFTPCIRRRRRRQFPYDLDQEVEETGGRLGAPRFPRPHLGDALRRISHNPAAPASGAGSDNTASTPVKDFDIEAPLGGPYQNGSSPDKPEQPGSQASVDVRHGLPSPVSPPLPTAPTFGPPSRILTADSQTTARSPTWGTDASAPMSPMQAISPMQTSGEGVAPSVRNQRSTDSYATQAGQQGTVYIPEGITEEPDSIARDVGQEFPTRRRSSRLSDSVRRLARRASAAVRRASATSESERSEKGLRSPSIGPEEVLRPTTSTPQTVEPVDTEALGEAYSYYHDVDAPPAGSYGPPLSIHTTYAALPPGHSGTFTSPTQISTATPISPVSPAPKPATDTTPTGYSFSQRPTFGLDKDVIHDLPDPRSAGSRKKKGFPEPLQRMNSLPPQAIMSDLPSPPPPNKSEPSVNPMDIMKPSTDTEMGWMVTQELVKMSSSPSPVPEQIPEATMVEAIGQPTPDLTPEPEFMAPPEIEINGQDFNMEDPAMRPTPPPSSAISNDTSPGNTPDTRSTPFTSTPSPRSNDGISDKPDASPRQFPCDQCHRVFDQFHKLK